MAIPESRYGVLTCLALAVLACYANALPADFQFDDYNVIVNNPSVHTWRGLLENLGHGIRPILKLSYTLNWTSGLGVAGFHLTNIAIHLGNVLLVFVLTRHFVRSNRRLAEHASGVPFFTALLFAVHPIHTEAITYVCGRSIAMMTLFYLAGLLAYASGRSDQNKIVLYLVTPLCFVAALGVKETAVTFPLALLVWQMAEGDAFRTALRDQWPNWALLVLAGIFFVGHGGYFSQMLRSAELNSLHGNVATQTTAFLYLMRQWVFPFWLNIDTDLEVARGLAGHLPQLLFPGALFVLLPLIFRRRPWLGFGLAWALIQLLPLYLVLPRLDVANDRQMYLVSWPLAFALTAEMSIRLKRKTFTMAAAALALGLVCLTVMRNQAYQNEISLWEDTVTKSPGKARVHNNLGVAYELAGRKADARKEFAIALEIDPDYYKARNNLLSLERPRPKAPAAGCACSPSSRDCSPETSC